MSNKGHEAMQGKIATQCAREIASQGEFVVKGSTMRLMLNSEAVPMSTAVEEWARRFDFSVAYLSDDDLYVVGAAKKVYASPEFVVYGTIEEISPDSDGCMDGLDHTI